MISNDLASKPRLPRQPKVPPQIQVLNSTSGPSGSNRVVIDGVIFQFEEGGSKLTRIGGKLHIARSPLKLIFQNLHPRHHPQGRQRGNQLRTPVRNIDGLLKAIWSLQIDGELVLMDRTQELIRRASSKLPCRYFTKTGAFTALEARVTDALLVPTSTFNRLRLPTIFHYNHHLTHMNTDYHTNRPLQQSADMPILPRPSPSRHLPQIPPRHLSKYSFKLSPLPHHLTPQHPKLYPFPINSILPERRCLYLPTCQSRRQCTRL